jgi:ABC-type dipeptide/oligopeptide/nickel transport system ATPase component
MNSPVGAAQIATSRDDAQRGDELLAVNQLRVVFPRTNPDEAALKGIDVSMKVGETLGLVGESGSGKSTVCLAIMGLLPAGTRVTGEILFRGRNLLTLPERSMRSLRGREIGLIYQDPMAALNPVKTIGSQLREPLRLHLGMSKKQADDRAVELLERVGISAARDKLGAYPHEFSGGMRQRVVIAMAISCNPSLLIADEPTTALDVSVQAQVLELLRDLSDDLGLALLLVSHDLSVVAGLADRAAVMRYGNIVEQGDVEQVFSEPEHAYTRSLLASVRALEVDA